MRIKQSLTRVLGLSLLFSTFFAQAQGEPAEDVYSKDFILEIMRKTCDFQLNLQAERLGTQQSDINYEWVLGSFYTGVLAMAEASQDERYREKAIQLGERKNWDLDIPDTRNADWQCIGQVYLELFLMEKDPKMLQGIQRNIDAQIADPKPGRVDWWWCDSLYMAPPIHTRLFAATGDCKYLEYLNEMYWDTYDFLYDQEEHLFFRDKNYFDGKTAKGHKIFWSRGNGWVLGGLARLLNYLPTAHPSRPKFEKLFIEMSQRLAEIQPPDGMWRPSLLDPEEFNTQETSGTSFFTFGLAWGVNQGLLDREKFEPVIKKAWKGLVACVDENGKLKYVQKVAAKPGPVNPEDTKEYAVGAFLQAGNEIIKMKIQ